MENPAIPEGVKKQGADADELHKKLYPEAYQFDDPAKQAGPKPEGDQPPEGKTDVKPPAPKTEAKPEAKPEPKDDKKVEPKKDDWEQKYRVLQGKYEAEVPRLTIENVKLHSELKQVKAGQPDKQPGAEPQPAPKEPEKFVETGKIKEFQDEYPDIYGAVNEIVRNTIKAELDGFAKNFKPADKPGSAPVTSDPKAETTQNTDTVFWNLLSDLVPDCRKLNNDPGFLKFLETGERYTGKKKLQLLIDAYQRLDVATAAEFFRDYQADLGKAVAPKPEPEADEQTRDIAPPKGGRGGNPQTPNVKLIKESDINKFYRETAQAQADGTYLSREPQFLKREAEIELAVKEGRVVAK